MGRGDLLQDLGDARVGDELANGRTHPMREVNGEDVIDGILAVFDLRLRRGVHGRILAAGEARHLFPDGADLIRSNEAGDDEIAIVHVGLHLLFA
jgi:hypothetical protein